MWSAGYDRSRIWNAPVGARIGVGRKVRIIGGPCEQANGWVWWIVRVIDNDGVSCNDEAGWMNEWWINPDTGIGEYNLAKA